MLLQGACALVLSPAFPLAYVAILQTLSIPLLNFSRIPQVSPAAGASVVVTLRTYKTNTARFFTDRYVALGSHTSPLVCADRDELPAQVHRGARPHDARPTGRGEPGAHLHDYRAGASPMTACSGIVVHLLLVSRGVESAWRCGHGAMPPLYPTVCTQ